MGKAKKHQTRRSQQRSVQSDLHHAPPFFEAASQSSGTVPETIFKYEPLSLQAIQNLKDQSIYFPSPSLFNDPYDCAITAEVEEPTDSEVTRTLRAFLSRSCRVPTFPDEAKRQLQTMSRDELKDMFMKTAAQVLEIRRKKVLEQNGVSCFSETNDNLLMWSHYGRSVLRILPRVPNQIHRTKKADESKVCGTNAQN